MIELLQQKNNLIGSLESIRQLSTKNQARILVISDSHGYFRQIYKVIKNFGEKCDAFVFCGDGDVDIANILEEANEDESFRKFMPPVLAVVHGNCDSPSKTRPVSFDIGKENPNAKDLLKGTVIIPDSQVINVNGQNIYISHGNNEWVDIGYTRLKQVMDENNCKIALHGHTHVPANAMEENYRIINPGSVARPRDGFPQTFAILTVEKTFVDASFISMFRSSSFQDSFKIISF